MKKVTLIIGGSRGIGKSVYEHLKKRGDLIYRVSRSCKKNSLNLNLDITLPIGKKILIKFFNRIKINNLIFTHRYRGNDNNKEYDVMVKATNEIIKMAKFRKNNSSIVILGSIASQTIMIKMKYIIIPEGR